MRQKICARDALNDRAIDQVGIDIAERGQHVDHDREEHDQNCHQNFWIDGEPHPQNEQRGECDFRRNLQGENVWRERKLGGRRHAEQITDECAKKAAENKTGQYLGNRDAGMQRQIINLPGAHEFGGDAGQWRHDEGRDP